MPGTVVGVGDLAVNKTKLVPILTELICEWRGKIRRPYTITLDDDREMGRKGDFKGKVRKGLRWWHLTENLKVSQQQQETHLEIPGSSWHNRYCWNTTVGRWMLPRGVDRGQLRELSFLKGSQEVPADRRETTPGPPPKSPVVLAYPRGPWMWLQVKASAAKSILPKYLKNTSTEKEGHGTNAGQWSTSQCTCALRWQPYPQEILA